MPHPVVGAGPDPRTIARPWLGSYPPGVPPTYRYPDVLLTRFLDDAERDFPEVAAVDAPGVTMSYPEVVDLVDRFAGALETLGVVHDVPLGLALGAGPVAVAACFAAWRMGAVVVPLDPALDDAELHRRLAVTGCRVLVTDEPTETRVRTIRGALPALHATVVTSPGDLDGRVRRTLRRVVSRRRSRTLLARDEVLAFREVVDTVAPHAPQRHADPDDAAAVLFDTDGDPLRFSHRHLVAAAFQSRLWIPDVQAGRERILVTAALDDPQGLVAGMLEPVLSAATIVTTRDRSASVVADAITRATPTLLRGDAELFDELVAADADLTSLRACLATSGRLAEATVERFTDVSRGARLRRSFGPVAAAGLSHANPVYGRALNDAIGLPVSDTLACTVDPDDPERPTDPDVPGRLLVRGPQVTLARWDRDDAVGASSGWFDTGRLAHVDDAGWFTLVDEADDSAPDDADGILGTGPGDEPGHEGDA